MKTEFSYTSYDKTTKIHASKYLPEGEPKAVLQLIHGMCEYIGRYDTFAAYMAEHGVAVVGNDHLGHGGSVSDGEKLGYFSEKDGNKCLLEDIHTLRCMTEKEFPGIPYFILGHSMGSFLCRQYITKYGAGLSGAIIMGTGYQPAAALNAGIALCKIISKFKGDDHRSNLVNNMAFGGYNKKFEPARTPTDWLTKDTAVVDAYNADPFCTFTFTVNAYYNMFLSIKESQDKKAAQRIPKDLPLLITSGEDDPVGDFGEGVRKAHAQYTAAGVTEAVLKLYKNDRHEILNETDKEAVFDDIFNWMAAKIK